jgi:hypothetical protein
VNWEATGAAGEVLGAIAVLVTLIYLATQVRQSNNLARFNATTEIINQFNDESYAACAKDVRIELARWPTFQQGVEHWLSNYPEHAERPIFQPVVRPEYPPQGAAV